MCGKFGQDEKHCDPSLAEKMGDRQYGEWMTAGGSAKTRGERGGFAKFRKPESKGNDSTIFNPQYVAKNLEISSQLEGETRDGQYSCKNMGWQMILENGMGTGTSNARN